MHSVCTASKAEKRRCSVDELEDVNCRSAGEATRFACAPNDLMSGSFKDCISPWRLWGLDVGLTCEYCASSFPAPLSFLLKSKASPLCFLSQESKDPISLEKSDHSQRDMVSLGRSHLCGLTLF